jgi:bis(5'-adenosyl)-triphosphatase
MVVAGQGRPPLFVVLLILFMTTGLIGRTPRVCTVLALKTRSFINKRFEQRPTSLVPSYIMASTPSSGAQSGADNDKLKFGPFLISRDHVFYTSALSAAFVNLRPIVPGHVLVMPIRVVPLLEDLSLEEYQDLWLTVRLAQGVLKRHYTSCEAFNVAVQDGEAAGQSVPHAHVHLLPRKRGDYQRNDDVYDDIQNWAPRDELRAKELVQLDVPEDNQRKDRTSEEMGVEATIYRDLLRLKP